MSNVFKEWFQQYLDKGYSVIPDKAGAKTPAIKAWTDYCFRLPSVTEAESWSKSIPESNISVCLGEASGIIALDLDAEDQRILDIIMPLLPSSPVAKIGSKGETRFFRYFKESTQQLSFNGKVQLEILSNNKKTTIPPSIHPSTGQQYKWIGKSLLEVEKEDLPLLPPMLISHLESILKLEMKDARVDTHGKVESGRNKVLSTKCSELIRNRTPLDEAVSTLIEFDRNTNNPPLFSDHTEYRHTEVFTNAIQFYTNHLTTINRAHFEKNEEYEIPVTLSAVTKEMADKAAEGKLQAGVNLKSLSAPALSNVRPAPMNSNKSLPKAQGALGALIQNILENSFIKQPEFAYGASLAVMATLVGRKVQFRNMAPNLYVLNIGPSGCGKDAPQQQAKKWLIEIGADELLGAGDYVSDASLMDSLPLKPVRLDVIDEASGLLGAANRGGNSFDTKMADILCELYTSSTNKFLGRALADAKGQMNIRGACFRPNVSLICSTTPTGFSTSVSSKSLEKGLLGRFIMFCGERAAASMPESYPTLDAETKSRLRWWYKYEPEERTDISIGQVSQDVTELPVDKESSVRLAEIFREFDNLRLSKDDSDPMNPVIARLYQQMTKIIILHACGREFEKIPTINLTDVEFGYKMVLYIFDTMTKLLTRNIHSNKNEMVSNKVLSLIEEAGMDGIDKTDLYTRTRSLSKKERDDVLKDLEEAGLIFLNAEIAKGQRRLIYRSTQWQLN